jgi:hypothetical protein
MLRQGPIPLLVHAALEPLVAALLIGAPFLFGFSDQGAPTAVSIVAGIVVLVVAMCTCWRISLIKAIPLSAHLMLDLVVAAVLIASPFLFGFRDQGAPTAFFIVVGVLDLLMALGTRWQPSRSETYSRDDVLAEGTGGRRRSFRRAPQHRHG